MMSSAALAIIAEALGKSPADVAAIFARHVASKPKAYKLRRKPQPYYYPHRWEGGRRSESV